jgi:hypothetical protein
LATWYAVYEIATGDLVSTGTVIAADSVLAELGRAAVAIGQSPPGPYTVWNKVTHAFDTFAPPKEVLSKREFMERFTDTEWDDIIAGPSSNALTTSQRKTLGGALERLRWMDEVDLGLARVQNFLQFLVNVSLITAARRTEIIG